MSNSNSDLLPRRDLREVVPVSDMTIWRWLRDPAIGFPRPIKVNRRNYWRRDEIVAWLETQSAVRGEAA